MEKSIELTHRRKEEKLAMYEDMQWDNIVFQFKIALFQCGQVAMRLKGKVARQEKEPDSSIQKSVAFSDVDLICQEIILSAAAEVVPWVEMVSEELKNCPKDIRALFAGNQSALVLVVDPLDGTDRYLAGGREYGHMVGLLDSKEGRFAFGMIYLPKLRSFYWAIRDQGCFRQVGGLRREVERLKRRVITKDRPCSIRRIKRITGAGYERLEENSIEVTKPKNRSCAVDAIRVVMAPYGESVFESTQNAAVLANFHGHDSGIPSVLIEEMGGVALDEQRKRAYYPKDMARLPLVVLAIDPNHADKIIAARPHRE